jgi:uncharacterized protein
MPLSPLSLVARRTASLALAAAVTAVTAPAAVARAQQPAPPMMPPPPPQIVTTGTGEVRLTPDRATVLIAVETRAATAKDAAAENARMQRATLDALQKLGLPRERLSTVGYDVQPDYQYDPQGRAAPKVTGYVVRNTVRAEVWQIDQLGRVLDAALATGANRIGSVQFESSQADAARRDALAKAVAAARAEAEAMAKAAGGSISQLLELSSAGYVRPLTERADVMMARAAAPAPETPINPGELIVTANVTGRWAFK